MYSVKHSEDVVEFQTLDDAMQYAKNLGILVEIKTPDYVIVGKFGADEIKNGLTPDGHEYGWVKRR